jgi:hypothetical protein
VRGQGDKRIKQQTVERLLQLIRNHPPLYDLFGDRWQESDFYSIILQPFFISPMINTGDIMVGLIRNKLSSLPLEREMGLEDAIRMFHPFPIFERFVTSDILSKSGTRLVPSGTQVIMFTEDFNKFPAHDSGHNFGEKSSGPFPWPIFGAGERACAGTHLALPYLRILKEQFTENDTEGNWITHDLFKPEVNHRYSGRHLDNQMHSLSELPYFIKTVLQAMWVAKADKREVAGDQGTHCPVSSVP